MGCSTSGEIHGVSLLDDTLTVAIARFEDSGLRTTQASVDRAADSFDAGQKLAQDLTEADLDQTVNSQ